MITTYLNRDAPASGIRHAHDALHRKIEDKGPKGDRKRTIEESGQHPHGVVFCGRAPARYVSTDEEWDPAHTDACKPCVKAGAK